MSQGERFFDSLCQVRGVPAAQSARLVVSETDCRLEVVSFSQFVHLDEKKPIIADLEDGRVATLLDNVHGGFGSTNSYDRTTWQDTVTPNTLFIGSDAWPVGEKVRWATFSFSNAERALVSGGAMHWLSRAAGKRSTRKVDDFDKLKLLDVGTSAMTIKAELGVAQRRAVMREATELRPIFEVEFPNGSDIHEYVAAVQAVVQCFAQSFGYPAHPIGLQVHFLSAEEQRSRAADDRLRSPFETFYRFDEFEPPDRAWVGHAALQVTNDAEKAATAAVLGAWIERRTEWRGAYTRQYDALKSRNQIDRNRFVNAFAWVEAIPDKANSKDFSKAKIAEMTAAAIAASGLKPDDGRIARIMNSVGALANETSTQRLQRLVESARSKFGADLVPDALQLACLAAVPLRNAAAHGDIDWGAVDIQHFMRVTAALEALAFLLTMRDLPLSSDGPKRMRGHPLMEFLRDMGP